MSEDALWEDAGSIFRPSYSATWINCSGSLLPSRFAPDNAGEDAAIGTVFHWLMAEWQLYGRPDDWLGQTFIVEKEDKTGAFEVLVDDEMFVYAEECLARYADIPGDRFVETRVDISEITPINGQGGTADLAVCQLYILDIIDWKYGRGVQVFAEQNTQELCYAAGFFRLYDWIYNFQRIRLHIAQPRLNHWDVWEISRAELLEFIEYAKERAYAAWRRGADRTPSPKACQWCKVRVDCPALEALREDLANATFDFEPAVVSAKTMQGIANAPAISEQRLPEALTLSTEQLARIYRYRKLMEAWFSDIGDELTTRALQGEQVEGWKIVEGRSRRRWRDEQAAAEKLSFLLSDDQLYQRKLVSPNQCEKLLKTVGVGMKLAKAYLRTLIDRPAGKPTLAPDGDNRLSLPNIVDESFDEDEAAL